MKETDAIWTWRDLSFNYNKKSNVETVLVCHGRAREYYAKSLELCQALARETNTIKAQCDLAEAYEKMRDVELALGNEQAAQEYARKAAELRANLPGDDIG